MVFMYMRLSQKPTKEFLCPHVCKGNNEEKAIRQDATFRKKKS